ncbi:hypothetical protein NTE_01078 [Candidatus Nitrososphaera evergladensis SR1]|uniref:PEFG-CTERM sorting domain-containing protein n=1 Tax=Candidatus Nitrososphaera evergladensis SR1 TaxID=1459636 RepID=A0A075MNL7_9ARCH|nr:hypothetical protein [Candidatus Nitrososphaera evergladensis]AIF83151.1 hypothetical protein NTE_01078 [Candidatus Nitrososphaera evergladensis SR1]
MKLLLAGMAVLLLSTLAAIPAYAQNSSSGSIHAYAVYVNGKSYIITYSITGGSVKSIQTCETGCITAMIQADSDGKLLVNLPGGLLNSISFDTKYYPVIFLDEIEVFADMTHTNCGITLEIPFQKGSKQIDMAGSFIPIGETISTQENSSNATVSRGRGFELGTVANADTCNFSFDQDRKKLHIEANGPANKEEKGFFQIALPHEFLGGPYTVLAEGKPAEFESVFSNATGKDTTTISLQYDGDKVHNIDIIGTTVIPEFGPAAIAAVASSMAMLVILRFRHQ